MTETYGHYDRANRPVNTDDLFVSWDVPYLPGTLEAVGYRDGVAVCRETVTTAGAAARIDAAADTTELAADGRDICHVEIRLLDADGSFAANADNTVSVKVAGPARLIGLDNGKSDSTESMKGSAMRVFSGMLLAIIESAGETGEIVVTCSGEGLQQASVRLTAR
jgi:beta-galactosidase